MEGRRAAARDSDRDPVISRRTVLGGVLIGGAGLADIGLWRYRSRRDPSLGAAGPATEPQPLAIPEIMDGVLHDGLRTYDLELRTGVSHFFPGLDTPTLGINGDYLGPTLRIQAGSDVRINVTNRIGAASTLHWHGLHLPARMDGGPHQVIRDGETWSPEFTVKQRAAMFWYHSHMVPHTGRQVYQGLAGLIYVEDDETSQLNLPRDYGIDDIPLVLQDRAFNGDGSLLYDTGMRSRMMGMRGDVMLVNGTVRPYFAAQTDKLRLRLLNGSNSRFHTLGFADGRAFFQIGTDGGLLRHPVETARLTLAPGERAQIIVNLGDGRPAQLRTYQTPVSGQMGQMMRRMMGDDLVFDVLQIRPEAQRRRSGPLPQKLIALVPPDPTRAVRMRRFVLRMGMMGGGMMGGTGSERGMMGSRGMMGGMRGEGGMRGGFTINGKEMDMNRVDETVKVGTSEIWQIENPSMMAHPFHIHDVQFRILDRNGAPPAPGERGLKDTVVVNVGERVRLLLDFVDYADPDRPYMYHCHILEHEDAGMMGQFVVTAR